MSIEFKTPSEAWDYHYWHYQIDADMAYLDWLKENNEAQINDERFKKMWDKFNEGANGNRN